MPDWSNSYPIINSSPEKRSWRQLYLLVPDKVANGSLHIVASGNYTLFAPSDPCPTDLDRILTEGQDPDAQQYLVLGTVPIKGKNLGFWVPMHLLY